MKPYKDKFTPKFPTKFKLGDKVKYWNETWTIDGWCLVTNDEHAYELIRPFGKGRKIMGVAIKKGDNEFIKIKDNV